MDPLLGGSDHHTGDYAAPHGGRGERAGAPIAAEHHPEAFGLRVEEDLHTKYYIDHTAYIFTYYVLYSILNTIYHIDTVYSNYKKYIYHLHVSCLYTSCPFQELGGGRCPGATAT